MNTKRFKQFLVTFLTPPFVLNRHER